MPPPVPNQPTLSHTPARQSCLVIIPICGCRSIPTGTLHIIYHTKMVCLNIVMLIQLYVQMMEISTRGSIQPTALTSSLWHLLHIELMDDQAIGGSYMLLPATLGHTETQCSSITTSTKCSRSHSPPTGVPDMQVPSVSLNWNTDNRLQVLL